MAVPSDWEADAVNAIVAGADRKLPVVGEVILTVGGVAKVILVPEDVAVAPEESVTLTVIVYVPVPPFLLHTQGAAVTVHSK